MAYNTALASFAILVLVLGWFQFQNRAQTIREKIEIDSSLIENAVRLGDQFFLTQYFSSFMASPSLDFGGIKDLGTDEWVFYPSKTRMEEKALPSKFSLKLTEFKVRQVYEIGEGSDRWSFIYVLNFSYFYIFVAMLISLTVSLTVYFIVRSTLRNTGDFLVSPISGLANELDQINLEEDGLRSIDLENESHGFSETDSLLQKFNQMLSRIVSQQEVVKKAEVFKALNKLSQQVSHDVRSPLGALKASIENVERNPEAASKLMKKAVLRIEAILDDLKLKSEKDMTLAWNIQNTDLVNFIAQFAKEKATEYTQDQLMIEFQPSQFEIHRSIDRVALERAFSNLVNNSVEAVRPQKALVKVSLNHLQDGKVEIEISDNGPGIPEDLLNKVSEFGFSSGKKQGSGMGLAQVKETIEKMGGSFQLNNRPEGGLKVTLLI